MCPVSWRKNDAVTRQSDSRKNGYEHVHARGALVVMANPIAQHCVGVNEKNTNRKVFLRVSALKCVVLANSRRYMCDWVQAIVHIGEHGSILI